MYSTCLFCNSNLGTNEGIEHFQVGRRLAFDAAKGRLWVVCRRCERWNLTPLEERWEAIDECERLFSQTRLRVSTDNIGLAKLSEGLELVRIGNALRPEMAAWRYGDQFGRRRRRHLVLTGAGVAAVIGIAAIGPATGIIAGGGWMSWHLANTVRNVYQSRRVRVRLRMPSSETVATVRKKELDKIAVVRTDDDWGLRVPVSLSLIDDMDVPRDKKPGAPAKHAIFSGPEALRAAAKILPAINESGARARDVQTAVQLVAEAGEPEHLFRQYASSARPDRASGSATAGYLGGNVISRLPKEVRVALEMASHEEQERRALEGELALLEAAWRDAEEVAKIADDMFVPESALARLDALRKD